METKINLKDSAAYKKADEYDNGKLKLYSFINSKISKILHLFYRREYFSIFSFDLKKEPILNPKTAENLTMRILRPEDREAFIEMWQSKRDFKRKRFNQRIANGYVGIGTWMGDKLVGANWYTADKDFDYITGLWFKVAAGCCYTMDLHEHESYKDLGIGLATKIFCIREAKRRGFNIMFIATSNENKRMIVSARLLGFVPAGKIATSYIFRKPFSQWVIGDRSGRNKTLLLGG